MFPNGFNHGNSTKDADECPEHGHQVARALGLGLAITKPVGDGIRDVVPWRRRYEGVEEPVNVEVPRVVAGRHDGACFYALRAMLVSVERVEYDLGGRYRQSL